MTVKELKEKLEQFPENCVVLIPNEDDPIEYTPATHIARGVNEAEKEDDCSGCVYEDADGSTPAISNCVCCSRNVDFAKKDYYRKRCNRNE